MEHTPIALSSADIRGKLTPITPDSTERESIASELKAQVFGQDHVMDTMARLLMRAESGINRPDRPLASAILMGPPGVGKTETGIAVAKYMFGESYQDRMKILDMTEFSEGHTAARFFGSPPGYVGYGDGGAIDPEWMAKGRSVIVFDEIEKAHPQVLKALLQVLDRGTMTTRVGNSYGAQEVQIPFNNSFIVMTSNIGSGAIRDIVTGKNNFGFVGAHEDDKGKHIDQTARKELEKAFSGMPEFYDRVDTIEVFQPLEQQHYYQILDKFWTQFNKRMRGQNLPLVFLTNESRDHLIDMATNNKHIGGRDVRRVFEFVVESSYADIIMSGQEERSPYLVFDYDGTNLTFYRDPIPLGPLGVEMKKAGFDSMPVSKDVPEEGGDDPCEPPYPSFLQ